MQNPHKTWVFELFFELRFIFVQPSQPRASTRNPRAGLYFFYGLVPALIVGIYFVTPHLSKGIEPS